MNGRITLDEVRETLRAIYNRRDFRANMHALWDLRKGELAFSASEIESLARFVSDHWKATDKTRAALVVSRDVDFGVARMYEAAASNIASSKVMVFRDVDQAQRWLASGDPESD